MPTRICSWKCNICGSRHKTATAAKRCEAKHPTADQLTILQLRYNASNDMFPERMVVRRKFPGSASPVATYVRMLDPNGLLNVQVQDEDDHD